MLIKKVLRSLPILLLITSLFSHSAYALELDAAKAQGLVGETPKGYIAAINPQPSSGVTALVSQINAQRAEVYKESAAKAGVSQQIIEQRMAQRLYQIATPGEYLLQPDGRWTKQ